MKVAYCFQVGLGNLKREKVMTNKNKQRNSIGILVRPALLLGIAIMTLCNQNSSADSLTDTRAAKSQAPVSVIAETTTAGRKAWVTGRKAWVT